MGCHCSWSYSSEGATGFIRDWVEKGKNASANIFLLFGKRNRDDVFMLFNTVHLTQLNEDGKFPRATGRLTETDSRKQ